MRGAAFLAAMLLASSPVRAGGSWRWLLSIAGSRPSGWVQVRENAVEGTRLHFAEDLHVRRLDGIRMAARKRLSASSQWHLSLASYSLKGSAPLTRAVNFNGATIVPGVLRTATGFPHFLRFDTSWWRRLAGTADGPSLWGSAGLAFVLLNFKLHGTVAADSAGSETKEDFDAQELPIPMLGLHFRYPLGRRLTLIASGEAGHLPWVDSLRREGGSVRLAQTNASLSAGIDAPLERGWRLRVAAFSRNYSQHERSREDDNDIHLRDRGLTVGIGRPF